jgi:LacI family transcriptional regulator
VVPTSSDHGYLTPEVERGIAVVFVDRPGSGLDADTVMVDNRDAARRAVEQLVAKGHRRIGLVMDSSGIYTFSERLTGAREAIAAAGLEDDPALVSDRAHSAETTARPLVSWRSWGDGASPSKSSASTTLRCHGSCRRR